MSSPNHGWARRVATACLRFAVRLVQLAFILLLIVLPIPLTACIPKIGDAARRNAPAEVKRQD